MVPHLEVIYLKIELGALVMLHWAPCPAFWVRVCLTPATLPIIFAFVGSPWCAYIELGCTYVVMVYIWSPWRSSEYRGTPFRGGHRSWKLFLVDQALQSWPRLIKFYRSPVFSCAPFYKEGGVTPRLNVVYNISTINMHFLFAGTLGGVQC